MSPISSKVLPRKIQDRLDSLLYSTDDITRSAKSAIKVKKAHCFDGALIAAYMLEKAGNPPLLMDLKSNGNDDDHVVAIYKQGGLYGAIAKSNFVGLRYREPVYRTLRELALSYYNSYFNLKGERTLVYYSRLIDLSSITYLDWRAAKEDVSILADVLESKTHYRLFPKSVEKYISRADKRLIKGETFGLNKAGVYKG